MNRGEIEARVTRLLHRTDMTATDFDYAFGVATSAIGEALRVRENEMVYAMPDVSPAEPFPVPAEVRQIRRVEAYQSGAWRRLGSPLDYEVIAGELRLRWAVTGDKRMVAWVEPDAIQAGDGVSTNAVMAIYGFLYVWQVAAECAAITQDADMVAHCQKMFGFDVELLNQRARSEQYSAIAMVGG